MGHAGTTFIDTVLPNMAINEGWSPEDMRSELHNATRAIMARLGIDLLQRPEREYPRSERIVIEVPETNGKTKKERGWIEGTDGGQSILRNTTGDVFVLPTDNLRVD